MIKPEDSSGEKSNITGCLVHILESFNGQAEELISEVSHGS